MDGAEFLKHNSCCRCCLSYPTNLIDVFNSDVDLDIAKAIKDVCGIDISPQHILSSKICHECLSTLRASYSFRITSQQSDLTLQRILEGNIIVNEVQENCETFQGKQEAAESDHDLHYFNETIDESHSDETIVGHLTCPYCFKTFVHKRNLVIHKKRHITVGQQNCSFCPKRYHTKFDLRRHMISVHSAGHTFQCDKCDKAFPTRPEWNRHKHIHDEIKQFSCSECGMQFKQKVNAQQHFKDIHEQRRPHCCEICGKGFAFASQLKRHAKCKPFWQISVLKDDVVDESVS